ncbi:MAG TPA: hypothetical protein VEC06_05745 [Paucimonas sp.]|nr:hypothetical protein [Paucimonas sp.]
MQLSCRLVATICVGGLMLAACKPSEPPPDLIKTQRETLNNAKSVGGQLENQAEEQKNAVENAEK